MARPGGETSARECRILSRHLIAVAPSREIVARYRAARATLLGTGAPQTRVEKLAYRQPLLIGILDAGCGLVARDHPLRRKLLILTAILETTPNHARRFLPTRNRRPFILLELSLAGVIAACKALLGVPLVLLVGRR